MSRTRTAVSLLVFVAIAIAQTPRRTIWDGIFTDAQADRGSAAYSRSCIGCHALTPEGKAPLVGDAFWKSFSQKTAGDLVEFISAYMPNGAPGSLGGPTYEDIAAFMLKSNGFPAGGTELTRSSVAGVQIVPRDGSTELPAGALAHVVGCLTRSGANWVITNATPPERAENATQANKDTTMPLGNRRIELKFVVTKLDPLVGSRVAVNGLLIGAGGVEGINVTTVNRVADRCP
jgi:S-disulfanyl-L-cysteine oxidoreductase SoxD